MKKFPCWVCKGSGIVEEGERVDIGLGPFVTAQVSPDIKCEYCNGEGMIEINSPLHRTIKRYQLQTYLWTQFAPKDFDPPEDRMRFVDTRMNEIIDELESLFNPPNKQ